ncbi:PDZ domain-containing protein [Streptomyces sp. NPDC018031]|uniref:PDZ domain-containing protein n=1 Tax=Streptomyces sp. NPDC018031 TaxID=3365033 RepID=UPI0037BB0661
MPAVSRLPRRAWTLTICGAIVAVLLAVAAFVPLPFSVAVPGDTVNVLGNDKGKPVISISGTPTRDPKGQLRMTTITATGPQATVRLDDVLDSWFDEERAVLPRDSVYPVGDSVEEIERHNLQDMRESQDDATAAALRYLNRSGEDIDIRLRLAKVGGPSAGLLFSLGIIDKLDGDGRGGDLTGGQTISGTGTIEPDGTVGPVGGVPLKTLAAKRDGATVFLVPRDECSEAEANRPEGLRLIPVTELKDAVSSLRALSSGKGKVPSC